MDFKRLIGYIAIVGVGIYIYNEYKKINKSDIKIEK